MGYQVPRLDYFERSNQYSAAVSGMRFLLAPKKSVVGKTEKGKDIVKTTELAVTIWPDPWEINRTDPALKQEYSFAFTEEGREQVVAFLQEQYQANREMWDHCPSILDAEPWYPPQEQATEETET